MEFDTIIDGYRDNMVEDLAGYVRIPSVEAAPEEGYPFGRHVGDALQYALNLSTRIGGRASNIENYIGYADFFEGEETVGVLVHTDVVPAGENWAYPPYAAEIHDGKMYGRGTTDNKGPAIACLYAARAIIASGVKPTKKLRFIFGTNEETGWQDIPRYLAQEKPPHLSIVPDAQFPFIYAEKGILDFKLLLPLDGGPYEILEFTGGQAINSVPDYAVVTLKAPPDAVAEMRKKAAHLGENDAVIRGTEQSDALTIECKGKAAHGSTPEQGSNAISKLFRALEALLDGDSALYKSVLFYNRYIGMDYNGALWGIDYEDTSGKLTCNIGKAAMHAGRLELTGTIRYPVTSNAKALVDTITTACVNGNASFQIMDQLAPIYHDLASDLPRTLLRAYQAHTGDHTSAPIAFGGATYARAFPNAIAFGAEFPGQQVPVHDRDEYISLDSLVLAAKIYASALYELIY